jgi:hypothetical protein
VARLTTDYATYFGDGAIRQRFDETAANDLKALLDADQGRIDTVGPQTVRTPTMACSCQTRECSSGPPWMCHGIGRDAAPRLVRDRGELAAQVGLSPARLDRYLAALDRLEGRRAARDREGNITVTLTGPSGSWGKALAWRASPPSPLVGDSLRDGPEFGVVYSHLRGHWYVQRSGSR